MSKLNGKGKNTTTNIRAAAEKHGLQLGVSGNGNLQFKKEPLQMLYELTVSTLFGKGTFYKSSDQLVANLRKHVKTAVSMDSLDYVANLAVYARTEMNIRTIPIVLVVEFAKALHEQKKSYAHMRQLVCDVIQRADQITDLYAYALEVFGSKNKIPMAIKRGVGDAFNKFGEYNYAKYNRDGAVKFRDVLRIVHPVAKDEKQGTIFEKIMKDTLEAPYTWEVELSKNGQLAEQERKSKKQLWTELVQSGQVGYMALLRNMRNICEASVDASTIAHVADIISDPKRVATSKQLPFDFVEAYKVVQPLNSKLATAVSKAIDTSVANVPKLGNGIWIIIDYSGSMGDDNGVAINTATLLAASLIKANEGADNLAVTLFGSAAKTIKGVDTNTSVLGIQKDLLTHRRGNIAGSTNFDAALAEKSRLGFEPDTIVVLTDGEVNGFPYARVKNIAKGNVVKLTVNLQAADTTPMPKEDGWYTTAGWSSNMFKWIPAMRDKVTVVDALSVAYKGVPKKQREVVAEEAV